MNTTLHVVVRGRVQGIGFRWFVTEQGRALGLSGWVRNLSDGTVEVLAAGDESKIGVLLEALGRGPDGARVQAVEHLAPTALAEPLPDPFTIQR